LHSFPTRRSSDLGLNTQSVTYAINVTQMATQGNLLGSLIGADSITLDSDSSFTLKVDGETTATISLAAGAYDKSQILEAIQEQLNQNAALQASGRSVQVSLEGDRLSFTSGTYGSKSSVHLTAVDESLASQLGLSTDLSGTAGQDVAGTIGGIVAKGDGQVLYLGN